MDTHKKREMMAQPKMRGSRITSLCILLYIPAPQCQHLMPSFAIIWLTVPVCTLTSLVMSPSSLRLVNTQGGVSPYQRLTLVNSSRSAFYRP